MPNENKKKFNNIAANGEHINFGNPMEITQVLTAWYDENKRDLPWRNTKDPYRIWLSEIILQQTRVDQGLSYYHRFIERFPAVQQLAEADINDVLKLWQGLGYYSRARNLHETAKIITDAFQGKFPDSYEKLLQLKGVGPYTASAVSSIAFGKPVPVLDGNVARVVSRLFAVTEPVNEASGKKSLYSILEKLIDKTDPGRFNQAIMEFGALWCTPRNPPCEKCVLSAFCMARAGKIVEKLPVKTQKINQRKRYFNYFVIKFRQDDGWYYYLRKRTGKDIWLGLYDFPMIETPSFQEQEKVLETARLQKILIPADAVVTAVSDNYRHQLTHQLIHARFFSVEVKNKSSVNFHQYIMVKDFEKYPLPKLIENFLLQANEF
jgi:A/G-specific adenine glycosylase